MDNYDWIKEVPNYDHQLDSEMKLITENIGVDALVFLIEQFGKSTLTFSARTLNELKKKYILKYYTGTNASSLSRTLNVSKSFIYTVVREERDNRVLNRSLKELQY